MTGRRLLEAKVETQVEVQGLPNAPADGSRSRRGFRNPRSRRLGSRNSEERGLAERNMAELNPSPGTGFKSGPKPGGARPPFKKRKDEGKKSSE